MNWEDIQMEEQDNFDSYTNRRYSSVDCSDNAPLLSEDEVYREVGHDTEGTGPDHCHWSRPKPPSAVPQLVTAVSLCAVFMVAELIGGLLANSVAVACDAAHLLSDCAGFGLALVAHSLAARPPNARMSYGYARAEVLGALLSVSLIWLLTGIFVYVAACRLWHGEYDIDADTMLLVSGLGVVINVIMGLVLHGSCSKIGHLHGHSHGHGHGHTHEPTHKNSTKYHNGSANSALSDVVDLNGSVMKDDSSDAGLSLPRVTYGNGKPVGAYDPLYAMPNGDCVMKELARDQHIGEHSGAPGVSSSQSINVRAAIIHVVGDLVQSVGVFIAAVVIKIYPNAKVVDPICTFVFSVIVMATTIQVMREAVHVLMEAVPHNFKYSSALSQLGAVGGVRGVHSLHAWTLANDNYAITAHLTVDEHTDRESVLQSALCVARTSLGASQATIQVERHDARTHLHCTQCRLHA